MSIPVFMAQDIAPDSWLNQERYRWFRRGYSYACTQTRAIPALAKCAPEELEAAVWAIMRANGWEPDALPQQDVYGYDGYPQRFSKGER